MAAKAEMKSLRRIVNTTRMDRERNNILEKVWSGTLIWAPVRKTIKMIRTC